MKDGKGTLKHQTGIRYFIFIEGVFKKKKKKLKQIRIPFDLEEGLDGEKVEVLYEEVNNDIKVKQIIMGDKKYGDLNHTSNHKEHSNSRNKIYKKRTRNSRNNNTFSKTPYNFVPLNERVLTTDIHQNGRKGYGIKDSEKQNSFHKGRYSGSVSISITNETPLFIGNRKVESQVHSGFNEVLPFTIQDKPAIPGSSIRGLLYALYEIAAFAPMVNMEDKPVYFRSTRRDFNKNNKDLRFGILSHHKSNYEIYDLNEKVRKLDSKTYRRELQLIDDEQFLGLTSGRFGKNVSSFGISKNNLSLKNCKRYSGKPIEKVIKDYRGDANRDKKVDDSINIVEKAKTNFIQELDRTGCPVWFSLENGSVNSIGYAKYHRIPADSRTTDMLPDNHREAFTHRDGNNGNEFFKNAFPLSSPEIMFGTSFSHSSKVRVTDATSKNAEFWQEPQLLKSLQSPKIKSANLYLQSKNGKPDWQEPVDDQKLRGFKQYYNKSDNYQWYDNIRNDGSKKSNQQKNLQSIIRPIRNGAKFKSEIHFKNLSKEELGGLLFVLKLKDSLRHSFGMGKPYGLGRAKIKIESLKIYDFKTRYTVNSITGGLNKQNEVDEYVRYFEKTILNKIRESNVGSLWDLDRFKNLEGLNSLRQNDDMKSEYMKDYNPFEKKHPLIDDPENLSDYDLVERNQYLKG